MKIVKTSDIVTGVAMPISKSVFDHLQASYKEAIDALAKCVINDYSGVVILYGCVNTGTGLNYIISAGAVYYAGEIYLVDATTFTAASTAVGVIVTTNGTGDPVLFSDGNTRNILNIKKVVIQNGVTGSGIANFSSFRKIMKKYRAVISQTGTDAPVVSVLENTFGGTIVWSRFTTGVYEGALVGAFPNPIFLNITSVAPITTDKVTIGRNNNALVVTTYDSGLILKDGVLSGNGLEIYV